MHILLLLLLFVSVTCAQVFQCMAENNNGLPSSLHSKSLVATNYRALDNLFIFELPCKCEYDWKNVFCSRLNVYKRVASNQAPSVCVCRQLGSNLRQCSQFLTRCFSDKVNGDKKSQGCSCCFNQPDSFCRQLECNQMKPDFGTAANVSCLCYHQQNYPDWICNEKRISTRAKLFYSQASDQQNEPYKNKVTFVGESDRFVRKESGLTSTDPAFNWTNLRLYTIPLIIVASLFTLLLLVIGSIFYRRKTKKTRELRPTSLILDEIEENQRSNRFNGSSRTVEETELRLLNTNKQSSCLL